MLEATDYLIIFLLGSFGGFLSGFLGVGGGIVYVPILDYFLLKLGLHDDLLVKCILANSLFTIIFSGSVASYKQYRIGNFFPKAIVQTALPGIITVLLTTYLIRNGSWYSREVFNYVFAAMLLIIAVRMFTTKPKDDGGAEQIISTGQYGITGFFTGIVTALSGLGGGVLMTPVFSDIFKQNIKKASSIANGVIPLLAVAVGIYNLSGEPAVKVHDWQIGYIVLPVVFPLILAAFVFAPLGVKASQKASQYVIHFIFAFFVTLVFIKTMFVILT